MLSSDERTVTEGEVIEAIHTNMNKHTHTHIHAHIPWEGFCLHELTDTVYAHNMDLDSTIVYTANPACHTTV